MPMLIFFCKSLPAHSSTTTACWENGYIDLDKAKCYFSSDWCLHLFLHLPVFLGKDIQAISKPFINAFLTKPTKGIYIFIYTLYAIIHIFVHFVNMTEVHHHIPPKLLHQNLWQIDQDRQSRPTAATLETHSWRTTKESCLSLGISGKDEQVDSKQEATRKNTRKGWYLTIYMPPPLQNKDAVVSGLISRSKHFTVHVDVSLGTC